jgi:hypothetical protein
MPLLASAGSLPPPSKTPPGAAPLRSPIRTGYLDPDGVLWDWADVSSGAFVTSVAGIGSAPSAPGFLTLPTGDMLVPTIAPGARAITIGLYAWDDDQAALLGRLDALAVALSHDRAGAFAPGTLIFTRPDGTARQIPVACTSGPDLPDDDGLGFQASATYGLTFQPLSPFFADAGPTVLTFTAAPDSAGVPPMPPVILTPSVVLGDTTVINSGDADAWPVWTIRGPGRPSVSNQTTGYAWSLATALGSGETRIIDTRPGLASVVDGTGADWWSDLVESTPRDLWQLVPGVNVLALTLAGSGAGSQIELSYQRRWRRA